MGFGSYDENEQEHQQRNRNDEADEEETEELNAGHYNGEVTFETEDVDSLLDTFKEIEEDN
jgi:hypothetical protein